MWEHSVENSRIILAGAGNLATCLGTALVKAGVTPTAIWSRSEASASALAAKCGCPFTTDINALPDADIVITAVSDDALPHVAGQLAARYSDALLAHTAGSVAMDIWREAGTKHYGVFYPMQTFSKSKEVDFSHVGIFIEACAEEEYLKLEQLANRVSPMVYRATSRQRGYLHIAAVYACNFANAMYSMAYDLLEKEGLPFEVMLPLIDETAAKLHHLSPAEAQTGPARRGDETIMRKQQAMLDGTKSEVYALVSSYIAEKAKNNKQL